MKKILLIITILILTTNVYAINKNNQEQIMEYEKQFEQCLNQYQENISQCPEEGFVKCNAHKISVTRTTQECYKNIAINIFTQYYNLSSADAAKKIDEFTQYMYNNYLFITNDLDFCKKNNCGTSVYLYSEYATTKSIEDYVNRLIITLQTHFNTH